MGGYVGSFNTRTEWQIDVSVLEVAIAVAVSSVWCMIAPVLGPRLGFVDMPDRDARLKVHRRPAVPLGGIGVFAGVHLGLAVGDRFNLGLFVASAVVLVLGLIDDRLGLSPIVRLGVELTAGVLLMGFAFEDSLGPARFLIGVIIVVITINAVNLFDGLDGLAGSAAIVAAIGLALMAANRDIEPAFSLILAVALVGFLPLNWHPARVFLGDNGAYVVGLLLAFAMLQVGRGGSLIELAAPVSLLGVFALDLVVAILRRLLNARPLFEGDRSHIYDQLVDRGLSVPTVALLAGAGEATVATIALAVDNWFTGVAVLVLVAALLLIMIGSAAAAGFLQREPS